MKAITHNVRDIEADDRRVLERVIGQQLNDSQKVIIQIAASECQPAEKAPEGATPAGQLPAWCNVFDGLTGPEIAEVEAVIRQRSDLTRPSV